MNSLAVFTFLVALTTCSALYSWEIPKGNLLNYINHHLTSDWLKFKKTYNRTYNDSYEELKRRVIWEDARREVDQHNQMYEQGKTTFEMGENDFSDMTYDEFQKIYMTGLRVPEHLKQLDEPYYDDISLNASLRSGKNWAAERKVSPVRNQGRCGSCWAFAAVGAIESAEMIHRGKGMYNCDYSEQNLVDCAGRSYGNFGCRGGWMANAYKYIISAGGLDDESCYRYRSQQTYCRFRRNCIGSRLRGYKPVPKGETNLQVAVANQGPCAIAVDVNSPWFMRYRRGVFNNPRCNRMYPNHAMLVVGYGTEGGRDYWLVKNSWGVGWGDRGYIKMTRNQNDQCGISSYAVYPLVK